MPGGRDLAADVDIDVAGLMSEIWNKKWLVLALTLLTGVALLFVLQGVAPRYQSSARVLIEQRESVFTRRNEGDYSVSGSQFDEQAIGSQVQILISDDVALKVISSLSLTEAGEFDQDARPSLLGNILVMLGMKNTPASVSPEQRILKSFRERLTVYAADKSRVLVVEFWAQDPALAQKVPNAIVDEYLDLTKQAKLDSNVEATQWLGPEIEDLRARVREAEAKVAEFRASSDILVGTNNALLATQQLSETTTELSRLRAERSGVEAKAASIRAALDEGGSLDVIPEVISSPLIQRLRERQVSLQAEISELSTTMLPNHPRIKALRSQLVDFDSQIRQAARNILKSLENNVDLVRKQEADLAREVDRLKAEASRVGEAEVELRALEREAAAQRELLETYLTQYREAASRQSREYLPVNARIISRAILPAEAYFPKVIPLTVAGMMTVLVLTIVGILAWALMTGKAFKAVDVIEGHMIPERLDIPAAAPTVTGAPPEGRDDIGETAEWPDYGSPALPEIDTPPLAPEGDDALTPPVPGDNDPEIFVFHHAAEAIANLGDARLAVVSPAGDPGSLIAWMLARGLAGEDRSVAVVDLTGTSVTSREMLGDDQPVGLRELLAGSALIDEAIHRDRISEARILPSGGAGDEPGALAIDRLASIAEAMAGSFDFLVFDCGYTGPEGLKLVADRDTIVVVSCEGSTLDQAADAACAFRDAGFKDTIMVRLEPSGRETVPEGAAA